MTRSACLFTLALAFAIMPQLSPAKDAPPTVYRAYFGTYTGGDGGGIHVCELDVAAGTVSAPRLAVEAVNPSFLAIHPSHKFLYAVGEVSDFQGSKTGGVSALAIDAKSGSLTLLNQQPSGGAGPCHLVVDAAGRNVLVANYGGGSVACVPIDDAGKLKPASAFVQHRGSSVDRKRQEGPHAHSINLDPAGRFAIAADLGLDQLLVYRFDAAQGSLAPHDPPHVSLPAGGGPRHFAWHPSGKFAYANNEMTSTVSALSFDAARGAFTVLETLSTLPAPVEGNSTAEVRVQPNGRCVYVSNRGHNSIAQFRVDAATGRLTPMGHVSSGGKVPRNFNLDPTGRFLLAANQDSHNVVLFRVDAETGQLTPTGVEINVPRPVCVRFVPR